MIKDAIANIARHVPERDLNEAARAADATREATGAWLLSGWDKFGSQGGIPVTHLRKMMLEELQRRNYAETTIRSYIRIVKDFSRRFQRSPDRPGA